jgi:hypothetical protein
LAFEAPNFQATADLLCKYIGNCGLQQNENNNLKAARTNSARLPGRRAAAAEKAAFNLLFEWLKK